MYFFYSQCSTQESTTSLNQTVRMKKSYSLKNRSLRNRQPVRSDTQWIHKNIQTIKVFQDQCWFILYTFTLLNLWGKYCTFYLHCIYLIIIVTLQSGDYRQVFFILFFVLIAIGQKNQKFWYSEKMLNIGYNNGSFLICSISICSTFSISPIMRYSTLGSLTSTHF